MGTSISGLIGSAASEYGVPPAVLSWQINQESSGNPNAYNAQSGTAGIAQFSPSTAAEFGINPYDPTQAIPAAAQYDAQLYQQTGSWTGALTSYGTLSGVPPSVTNSWQNMLAATGTPDTGAPINPLLDPLAPPSGPSMFSTPGTAGYAGTLAETLASGWGPAGLSQWEEIAIRAGVGIVGLVLVAAGFMLAGKRGAIGALNATAGATAGRIGL